MYGSYNNSLGMPPMVNSFGQQSSFNSSMGQPYALNQPLGPQNGYNPPVEQPQVLNQPTGQQSGFNPSVGHPNMLSDPLNQQIQPNIYNPASAPISSFNQAKSFGQLPNLNQQPTFQPIQSNLHNFSHAIPPSPNFNQPQSSYNQRAPSGKLAYLFTVIIFSKHYLLIFLVEPLPTNYQKKPTPSGWNDPPMFLTSTPVQVIL